MDYAFGFSVKGLIVFLLPMVPNLLYFLFPKNKSLGNVSEKHLVLDIIEHGSQAVFILLLVFLPNRQDSPVLSPYTLCFGSVLFLYFVLWIFYFSGSKMLLILFGLAILPVIYFILAEIWLHNYPAVIPTAVFGIAHTIITYIDARGHSRQ